jgi:adenylate cyclase
VAREIERKFLVRDASAIAGHSGIEIRQGYLSVEPERTVRVRLAGPRAFVTIKGLTSESGASRAEYEYEIPPAEAVELLERLAIQPVIEKTRYRLTVDGRTWEVDVFKGRNEGLAVAEVELASEDEVVVAPDWAGDEITGDPRYYNASLVRRPYRDWPRRKGGE